MNFTKIKSKFYLTVLYCFVFLNIVSQQAYTQCNFLENQVITFDSNGGNIESDYSTIYVLTDAQGDIQRISDNTSFQGILEGTYNIYSINYLNGSNLTGLNLGGSFALLDADCIDISAPIVIDVCGIASCDFCDTDIITFNFENDNSNPDYITNYILVNQNGIVIEVSSVNTFSPPIAGSYSIVAINYFDDNSINGLVIGGHVSSISADCIDFSNSIGIKICETFFISLSDNFSLCAGQSVSIVAGTNGNPDDLIWTDGTSTYTGNAIFVTPMTNTVYTVTLEGNSCTPATQVSVTVEGQAIEIEDQIICQESSLAYDLTSLEPSGQNGGSWSVNGSAIGNPTNVEIMEDLNYTYRLPINDCVAIATLEFIIFDAPSISLVGDAEICEGASSTISVSQTFSTYAWSTGSTNSSITVSPSVSSTYTVTITDTNNCSNSSSLFVEVIDGAAVNIADQSVCQESSLSYDLTSLEPAGQTGGSWSTNGGAIANPTDVGLVENVDYTYTLTVNGCTSSASIEFEIYDMPGLSLVGDAEICEGASTTISVSQAFSTYAWSTGSTNSSITVSPSVSSTYTVTITDTNNCSNSSSLFVEVIDGAAVNIADQSVCQESSLSYDLTSLEPAGQTGGSWSTNGGAIANPTDVGLVENVDYTYTLTVNGCTSSASIEFEIYDMPGLSLVGDAEICEGASTTISVSQAFSTYAWSTGSTNSSITVSPSVSSTYTVTITDTNNCSNSSSLFVEVIDGSAVNIADQSVCQESVFSYDLTLLEPAGQTGGNWTSSGGAIANPTDVNLLESMNYTYSLTLNGCASSANVEFEIYEVPSVTLVGDAEICPGDPATISVIESGYSYLWDNGAMTSSIIVFPSQNTTYSVTITDSDGCTNNSMIEILVNQSYCNIACDIYSDENLIIAESGGNNTADYTTVYVVASADNQILSIHNTNDVGTLPEGMYHVYAINYMTSSMVSNLEVGISMNNIDGECLDVSDVLIVQVCDAICDIYSDENLIIAESGGNNTADYTTVYVVASTDNQILSIHNTNDVGTLPEGMYHVYAINYMTSSMVSNLEVGISMNNIDGECLDVSDVLVVQVCDAICDIYSDENLIIVESGGNNTADYTTVYVVASTDNQILSIHNTNDVGTLPEGMYHVYAINYLTSSMVSNLEVGMSMNSVIGECLDISESLVVQVCSSNTASIGNFVFSDANANGLQDPGESGINGISVYLYSDNDLDGIPDDIDNNGSIDANDIIETQLSTLDPITGLPGSYNFNVVPGSYIIGFDSGIMDLFITDQNVNGGNATSFVSDSDVDPLTGWTSTITVVDGDVITSIDAGFYETVSIGSMVFIDYDNDGSLNNEDEAFSSIVSLTPIEMELFFDADANGTLEDRSGTGGINELLPINQIDLSTAGTYLFDGLKPGNYAVGFLPPFLFPSSSDGNGSDDNVDNDDNGIQLVRGGYIISDIISLTVGEEPTELIGAGNDADNANEMNGDMTIDFGLTSFVLPVKLVDFYGEHIDGESRNELTWIIGTQLNSDKFIVERSLFNTSDFNEIGTVDAAGTSNQRLEYYFDDNDVDRSGNYYYRIRQVDLDGKIEIFGTIVIEIQNTISNKIVLYPNPASTKLNIEVPYAGNSEVKVSIVNKLGQVVLGNHSSEISVGSEYLNINLNVSAYPKGAYVLILDYGEKRYFERFIKI